MKSIRKSIKLKKLYYTILLLDWDMITKSDVYLKNIYRVKNNINLEVFFKKRKKTKEYIKLWNLVFEKFTTVHWPTSTSL